MAKMETIDRLIANRSGIRLDRYISEKYPRLSRTYAKQLIKDGHITIDGKTVKARFILSTGDSISIRIPSPEPSHLEAEYIPLNILYEDKDLLVVEKPAGLTVHPAPGNPKHTLVNAILAYFPDLPDSGDSLRPGVVHRLDKDTSGLILIAKNRIALNNLANQFKTRSVTKTYLVLVKGHLSPKKGFIEAPIGRDPHNRKRMAVVKNGRDARTEYNVLKYIGTCSLLKVKLETGRTHQIRVHLSAIGYPVVGDATYGIKSPFLSRQFVHAHCLGFKLPSSDEYKEFISELPPELAEVLDKLA
jgi:23S rRNA pseudouridine1911/1915/1917 synthase